MLSLPFAFSLPFGFLSALLFRCPLAVSVCLRLPFLSAFAFAVCFRCFLALLPSLPLLSFLRLCLYCLAFYVCDCFRAVFGQCRTPKTAPRAKHTESRQGERLRRACLACLIAFAIGAYCYNMRGLCLQGATPQPARGYFFGTDGQGERAKSVLLIPITPCSQSLTYRRMVTATVFKLSCSCSKTSTCIILKPIVPTVIIKRIQLKLSCSYYQTAGVHNLTTLLFSASWLQAS